jgi:hypothetical protein
MALTIGGNACTDPAELSDGARACLGLIDGGLAWVGWAIARQAAGYGFDDETALVQGVQEGLHGTGLMLLPALGLTVAPARLMALEPQQIKALAKGEAGGALKPPVRKLLTEAGLLTAADLAIGTTWLAGQGVADAPLFQVLDLADRIALTELAAGDQAETGLGKEASAFAVAEARAPAEFADYRRLYLALAARPGTASAAERQALARQCLDILLPWMFTALDCPAIPMPPTPLAVADSLSHWLNGGQLLGFSRATAGARQICERTGFTPASEGVGALIADYLRQASGVLAEGALSVSLGQDGRSMAGRAEGASGRAMVSVNALGHLSLEDFEPPSKPAEPS